MPEAGSLVASFRARYAARSVAKRIPAHITLLIPFAAATRISETDIQAARDHFHALVPFEAELTDVRRFEQHVWLAPSPRERFVDLARATYRRFPDHAPYGGAFVEPEPHLTIGEETPGVPVEEIHRAAASELGPKLPYAFRVESGWLFVEQEDGTWIQAVQFPFGS